MSNIFNEQIFLKKDSTVEVEEKLLNYLSFKNAYNKDLKEELYVLKKEDEIQTKDIGGLFKVD